MVNRKVFAIVLGSGFAGSILSWILSRARRECVLVDRAIHPRFAIGESSTPTADFLIAHLAEKWNLPELAPLSSFGSWQSFYPNILCGKKRGFSYFGHKSGQPFSDDDSNSRSLVVAASVNDEWSDTHWYRSQVDAFLAKQAEASGVEHFQSATIEQITRNRAESTWSVKIQTAHSVIEVEANWVIDATGTGNTTANWFGHHADDDWMRTRSSALFGHFDRVQKFTPALADAERLCRDYFDPDDAAQHQVTESGWYWFLRFLGCRASVGFVEAWPSDSDKNPSTASMAVKWKDTLSKHPSIQQLMEDTILVDPKSREGNPTLQFISRMSRCRSRASGDGWILMPVAYGFIDPLHSFGIAHSLSGIARIASILTGATSGISTELEAYDRSLRREVKWFDTLISGSYRGLPSFERYAAFASYYFVASIAFEQHMARDPEHWPDGYMCSEHLGMSTSAEHMWQLAGAPISDAQYVSQVRKSIEPWNTVGLLDPSKRNRFAHTAPPKRPVTFPAPMLSARRPG